MGQDFKDPQTLNRYTYCQNNPLKYTDPTGHSSRLWLNAMYGAYTTGLVNSNLLAWGLFATNGLNIGNALHEIAQVVAAQAISKQFGPSILEYQVGKGREADIVAAGQVWEVKPLGGKSPEPQLQMYTELGGLLRGDNTALSKQPINIPVIGNIRMEVTFGLNSGEIYYECYKYKDNGERVRVPNWQVLWEFEWRKGLAELGVAALVAGAILAPEFVLPSIPAFIPALT